MLADHLLERVPDLQVNKCTQIVVDAFAVRLLRYVFLAPWKQPALHLQAVLLPQHLVLYTSYKQRCSLF